MRVDLFTPIHKGLRRNLFETAIALGRTDFSSRPRRPPPRKRVDECLTYLREHAEHEDRHVVPEIARLSPELAATMAEEHPELERAAIAVDSLWPRFAPLGPRSAWRWAASWRGASRRWSRCSCATWTARSARSTPCSGRSLDGPRHRRAQPPHRRQHPARAAAALAAAGAAARLERARDRRRRRAPAVAHLTAPSKNWIARGSRAIVEG
jgi:hypothetical protein